MTNNALSSAQNSSLLNDRLLEILLVEDNPGDVRLVVEALKKGKMRNRLSVIGDGKDVLAFLRREGQYASAARPNLILLDLHLPSKGGYDVLAEIKKDPGLKYIPVVVLTTSNNRQDVLKAYELQANCYITKPVELEQFFSVIKSIEDFWLRTALLPSE